jgi:hypothetical protein
MFRVHHLLSSGYAGFASFASFAGFAGFASQEICNFSEWNFYV